MRENNLKVAGRNANLSPHDLRRIRAAESKRERRRLRNALVEANNGNPPDGVWKVGRDWMACCTNCEADYVVDYDIGDFDPNVNLCGGSDRCIP